MKPSITARLIVLLLLLSCKSTKKLYDEGNYERAIYSSVEDLKKNPENSSAQQVLPDAYNLASKKYLNDIQEARVSAKTDRLDILHRSYSSLQRLYNSISGSPAARNLVKPVDYTAELRVASEEAAEYYYQRGKELLNAGGKENAKKAHADFKKAEQFVPAYKDAASLKEEAYDIAVTHVALNAVRQQMGIYSINGSNFEYDILRELKSIGSNNFYAFYTVADAQFKKIPVDQYIDLSLYDIWFGTLSTNNYSYNVSKQITVPATNPRDAPTKQTVTATVNVTTRQIDSRAAMDCRITDAEGRNIIFSQRFPARYIWENRSGDYLGDARALSATDQRIVNGRYDYPPSYDELYRELSKKMLDDFNFRMRQLYGK
jgi:hypothetical protein